MRYCRKKISLLVFMASIVFVILSGNRVFADSIDPDDRISIDEKHFPDEVFRSYISSKIDTDSDGFLSKEEREAVEDIDLSVYDSVSSIKGLEVFPNVQRISASLNLKDGELAFEDFQKLESLDIGGIYRDGDPHTIDKVTIKNCPGLKSIIIYEGTSVKRFVIENCDELKKVSFGEGLQIGTLELSELNNLELVYFWADPGVIELRSEVAIRKNDVIPYIDGRAVGDRGFLSKFVNGLEHTIFVESGEDIGWYRFEDGSTAYLDADWNIADGVIKIDGVLYGFRDHLLISETGWVDITVGEKTQRLYFDEGGRVHTGWLKWNGNWYYLGDDGVMKTRWQLVDGKWYFMRDNGMMLRSQYIHGYWLNKDGSCTYKPVAKWRKDAVGVYYQDTSGYYVRNTTVTIDRVRYQFDKRGYLK